MWLFRLTNYIAVLAFLTGCGFQPLYGRTENFDIGSELASVEISVIEHRIGQQLRNFLLDRINPTGPPKFPAYTLDIRLSEARQELAVKKSALSTRVKLILTANFGLKGKRQNSGFHLTGTSKMVTGYNILTSDFANLIAEKDARTRAARELSALITNRVATFIQSVHRPEL